MLPVAWCTLAPTKLKHGYWSGRSNPRCPILRKQRSPRRKDPKCVASRLAPAFPLRNQPFRTKLAFAKSLWTNRSHRGSFRLALSECYDQIYAAAPSRYIQLERDESSKYLKTTPPT